MQHWLYRASITVTKSKFYEKFLNLEIVLVLLGIHRTSVGERGTQTEYMHRTSRECA